MVDLRSEFEKIALPFMDILYSGALRLTRDTEAAGDLMQDTYLRAYRSFAQFEPGTNCKAWLFKIMYSVFVNEYHRKLREPSTVQVEDIEDRFACVEGGTASILLEKNEPEVEKALNRLSEDFRMAVLLVDVEDCTYEEAASVLNCPVGTVRSRLYRGRKILHLELQEYARSKGYLKETK